MYHLYYLSVLLSQALDLLSGTNLQDALQEG